MTLRDFANQKGRKGKGALSLFLFLTDKAKEKVFPLKPDEFLVKKKGQVGGLSGPAVQKILLKHGITKKLAREGGRTNRGNIDLMRAYVAKLNSLNQTGELDLDAIEKFWVRRIDEFFLRRPFVLKDDPAFSWSAIVEDLLRQARDRQKSNPGATFEGTIVQHLIGAKLDLILDSEIAHHGVSAADAPTGRPADFLVGDSAIHVTVAPGEDVIQKCAANLRSNQRPILVVPQEKREAASQLAKIQGLENRIEIWVVEQFLSSNVFERGRFSQDGRQATAQDIIERYNRIIEENETDLSLKIRMDG